MIFPGEKEAKWYPKLVKACQNFIEAIDNPLPEDADVADQIDYARKCRQRYERMKTHVERIEAIRNRPQTKSELLGE